MDDIKNILGNNPKVKPLKSFTKRYMNRRLKPEKRKPCVDLILTENGKKYKVLKSDDKNNSQLNSILRLKDTFLSLNFVPRIVWSNENAIVADYIDGVFADFGDLEFAKQFGKNLAILHQINVGTTDKKEYLEKIFKCLEFIYSKSVISEQLKNKCYNKIISRQPDELRTSMTYSNMHNEENFVVDKNNKLWFIDFGSFKEVRVTDDALFGYKLFKSIDKKTFWKSYFESGGPKYLIENEMFLKITQLIRKGALHLEKYYKLSNLNMRTKRHRLKRTRWMVNELVNEIDRNLNSTEIK